MPEFPERCPKHPDALVNRHEANAAVEIGGYTWHWKVYRFTCQVCGCSLSHVRDWSIFDHPWDD